MKYLVKDSADSSKWVIVSATGFTLANSIPLPQHLEGEEAEWLVVQDVLDPETQVLSKVVAVDELAKAQILDARNAAAAQKAQEDALRAVLKNAVAFGTKLMEDFVMENIAMGITADNMSEAVLDAMAPVESALRTGTLHVALKRLKEVPVELKDPKYITDARLLAAVNKLENYLGLQQSGEL